MPSGKRYEGQPKLNIKKVISLIIGIIVIIMVILSLQKLLQAKPKEEIKLVNVEYYSVYTNGKWGVIDTNGDIVINPEYNEMVIVPNYQKGVFICTYDLNTATGEYKTKALNEKNEILYANYDSIAMIDNRDKNNVLWYEKNILKVSKDGKYGIINFDGKEIIKCEYDEIVGMEGITNTLLIKKDNKYGVANGLGVIIINPEYDEIIPLGEKADDGYIVKNNNTYGIAVTSRKIVFMPQYDEIAKVYSDEYYVVKKGNWKVVSKTSEVVLENAFDEVIGIEGENFIIKKDNKYGVISKDKKSLIPVEYDSIKHAFNDYYIVSKNGKYGLLNINNEIKLELNYNNMIYRIDAGFLEADNTNNLTEVYDKELNKKITGIISEVNINDGYIRVWQNSDYKYYNFKFEEKSNIDLLKGKTLYLSKKDNKYGYVDKNNKVIIDYIYDDAREQNEYGYCAVKKGDKWGAIDKQGKLIQEPKYLMENNVKFDFIGKWHIGRDLNMNYYTDM